MQRTPTCLVTLTSKTVFTCKNFQVELLPYHYGSTFLNFKNLNYTCINLKRQGLKHNSQKRLNRNIITFEWTITCNQSNTALNSSCKDLASFYRQTFKTWNFVLLSNSIFHYNRKRRRFKGKKNKLSQFIDFFDTKIFFFWDICVWLNH